MKIYVLGICGTFMGGLAQLAAEKGIKVSGCDENVYPPMDQVLLSNGITIDEGYNPKNLPNDVDLVVVGNVIARGNPMIEEILNKGIDFISGPGAGSRPRNLMKGNTGALTHTLPEVLTGIICLASGIPMVMLAAILANGKPDDFATNGTVLEERGLTSKT